MKFLRYPGGKSKILSYLVNYLPKSSDIKGTYIEPFVGGGSVFFFINSNNALISDLNSELITLYKGIKLYPHKVWEIFESFPRGKIAYYKIRNNSTEDKPLYYRAARTLFLTGLVLKECGDIIGKVISMLDMVEKKDVGQLHIKILLNYHRFFVRQKSKIMILKILFSALPRMILYSLIRLTSQVKKICMNYIIVMESFFMKSKSV